jgi:hypothetical protein
MSLAWGARACRKPSRRRRHRWLPWPGADPDPQLDLSRSLAGVTAGESVTVTLEPDTEKRDVEIPPALRRALGAKLTAKLQALSFTHKKEYAQWFTEAKKGIPAPAVSRR